MPVILKASTSCYLLFRLYVAGTSWRSWLRHRCTNRKVAGSIHDGAIAIFLIELNPSGCMALGSTQPLTEMSTRNIYRGVKVAGAQG
jgi:hypothetical protein